MELEKIPVTLEGARNLRWSAILEMICRSHKLRLDDSRLKDKLLIVYRPEFISVAYNGADIREAIMALATSGNLNVVLDPDVTGTVTARLSDVTHAEALEVLVKTAGYEIVRDKPGAFRVR